MSAENSGSGGPSPEPEPKSGKGLRLRLLPAASNPAFPLDHDYFEIVYTPLVGPTAVLLARAMVRHVEAAGGPTTVCPIELSMEVGIRSSSTDPLGRRSHLVHAIDRLAHDRIVARLDGRTLGVHTGIPPLSARSLSRLPATTREAHVQLVTAMEHEAALRSRSDPEK